MAVAKEALMNLMIENIGKVQNAAGKTDSFKCLPSDGIEVVAFWENKTTRILLLHQLPDEEWGDEDYYLHFEAK